MDFAVPKSLTARLGKFRWPLLVFAVGLGLMLLPAGQDPEPEPVAETRAEADLESQLEAILSRIAGAGEVQVLLTEDSGRETRYQTDVDDTRQDTVLVEGSDRTESGLVRQTVEPRYRGAVVVCPGADDPKVRLAIVEAVCCVTGLGADRISEQKMR